MHVIGRALVTVCRQILRVVYGPRESGMKTEHFLDCFIWVPAAVAVIMAVLVIASWGYGTGLDTAKQNCDRYGAFYVDDVRYRCEREITDD